jgi:hypothetical protein
MRKRFVLLRRLSAVLTLALVFTAVAPASTLRVTITSLAPANGTFLTPLWVGFHDGSFDLYDIGAPATTGLERLAEDGDTGPLSAEFTASGAGMVQGTIPGPSGPLAPGQVAMMHFSIDGALAANRYFSYASMVIPSNDAFIANGNPLAHPIFDSTGNFLGADFVVSGAGVRDAGTEVNDELPMNTAFFGQANPNTGVPENGTVQVHSGFIPGGPILSTSMFASADFTAPGYQVARIQIEQIAEPVTPLLTGFGLLGLIILRTRARRGRGSQFRGFAVEALPARGTFFAASQK